MPLGKTANGGLYPYNDENVLATNKILVWKKQSSHMRYISLIPLLKNSLIDYL